MSLSNLNDVNSLRGKRRKGRERSNFSQARIISALSLPLWRGGVVVSALNFRCEGRFWGYSKQSQDSW